jgi:hypothetical protein
VRLDDGEAKIWLEPRVAVADNHGLSSHDLKRALDIVKEHEGRIRRAWQKHFTA